MIKRQRGRGRNPGQKPQNNNPNRAYESNGPDLKVRGSAQTVFEKYQQLGRDAQSSGDRVLGENYMQHAEHYYRVIRAMQPTFVPRSELTIAGYDDEEFEGDDNNASNESGENDNGDGQNSGNGQPDIQHNRNSRDNRDRNNSDRNNAGDRNNRDRDGRDRPPREFREKTEATENREPRADGDEDRFGRRRRRRPDRFGEDNGAANGQQSENNGGETRREPRADVRAEPRSDNAAAQSTPSEKPADFSPGEFAKPSNFSDPQEIIVASDAPPARERRPRPPRAPRAPRASAAKEDKGFGDELPAFLAAPVPATSDE